MSTLLQIHDDTTPAEDMDDMAPAGDMDDTAPAEDTDDTAPDEDMDDTGSCLSGSSNTTIGFPSTADPAYWAYQGEYLRLTYTARTAERIERRVNDAYDDIANPNMPIRLTDRFRVFGDPDCRHYRVFDSLTKRIMTLEAELCTPTMGIAQAVLFHFQLSPTNAGFPLKQSIRNETHKRFQTEIERWENAVRDRRDEVQQICDNYNPPANKMDMDKVK